MAQVLISFIGLGNYVECPYVYNGQTVKTHLFEYALATFYRGSLDRVILFHTEKSLTAKHRDQPPDSPTYIEQLNSLHLAAGLPEPVARQIPDGKNEDELWKIFEGMAAELKPGDEVIFDVTHAFRSIPILALLVISLLRETKGVKLKALVYGAWEARNENGEAPVFDLLPFVGLLDWLAAARQFKSTGNAAALSKLLEENGDRNLAEKIGLLSESLRLMRPGLVMELSAAVGHQARNETAIRFIKSKPVLDLLESIGETYSGLGLKSWKIEREQFLIKLLTLARWYLERGLFVQALSSIREFIPTLVCYKMGLDFFKRDDNRMLAEAYLNYREPLESDLVEMSAESEPPPVRDWADTKLPVELKEIWTHVAQVRNDVLHFGFNESPRRVEVIVENAGEFLEKVEAIFARLNIGSEKGEVG